MERGGVVGLVGCLSMAIKRASHGLGELDHLLTNQSQWESVVLHRLLGF